MAVIGAHMLLYTGGCQVQLYEPRHPLAIETAGTQPR